MQRLKATVCIGKAAKKDQQRQGRTHDEAGGRPKNRSKDVQQDDS